MTTDAYTPGVGDVEYDGPLPPPDPEGRNYIPVDPPAGRRAQAAAGSSPARSGPIPARTGNSDPTSGDQPATHVDSDPPPAAVWAVPTIIVGGGGFLIYNLFGGWVLLAGAAGVAAAGSIVAAGVSGHRRRRNGQGGERVRGFGWSRRGRSSKAPKAPKAPKVKTPKVGRVASGGGGRGRGNGGAGKKGGLGKGGKGTLGRAFKAATGKASKGAKAAAGKKLGAARSGGLLPKGRMAKLTGGRGMRGHNVLNGRRAYSGRSHGPAGGRGRLTGAGRRPASPGVGSMRPRKHANPGLPRTALGARRWAKKMSPKTRAQWLKKVGQSMDGLSWRRRSALARGIAAAQRRDLRRAAAQARAAQLRDWYRSVWWPRVGGGFVAGATWTGRVFAWRPARWVGRRVFWPPLRLFVVRPASWAGGGFASAWTYLRSLLVAGHRPQWYATGRTLGWKLGREVLYAQAMAMIMELLYKIAWWRQQNEDRNTPRQPARPAGPVRAEATYPVGSLAPEPAPQPQAPRPVGVPIAPPKRPDDDYDTVVDSDPPRHTPIPMPGAAPVAAPGAPIARPTPNIPRRPHVAPPVTTKKRGLYTPHPAQEAIRAIHRDMYSYIPNHVPGMAEHLEALGPLYDECADDASSFGSMLADQFPVATMMHDLFRDGLAPAYNGVADGARQTRTAYEMANPNDFQRNFQPRTNENWNNVPEGHTQGVDMAQLRQRFRGAHMTLFQYRPVNPPDMRDFIQGLYPLYMEFSGHIQYALGNGKFPGAGDMIAEFWLNLSGTWVDVAVASANASEGYESSAAAELARFDAPRAEEHLANTGRN